MANGNGDRWTKALIGVLSGLGGLAGGALAVGLWAGTVQATLDSHLTNGEIHQTTLQKEAVAQRVIDREVAPQLEAIKKQLDRIENRLDGLQKEHR